MPVRSAKLLKACPKGPAGMLGVVAVAACVLAASRVSARHTARDRGREGNGRRAGNMEGSIQGVISPNRMKWQSPTIFFRSVPPPAPTNGCVAVYARVAGG